jgi:hypothetical protein
MCSEKLRKDVRFCWKCNADQTSAGPPSESTNVVEQQESFGRPQLGQKRKAMSIESYLKAKSTERQSASTFRSKKKNTAKSTYAMLLEQALQKWSAYDKNFDASKEYVLLYDDDRCAQFMPGNFLTIYYYGTFN